MNCFRKMERKRTHTVRIIKSQVKFLGHKGLENMTHSEYTESNRDRGKQ